MHLCPFPVMFKPAEGDSPELWKMDARPFVTELGRSTRVVFPAMNQAFLTPSFGAFPSGVGSTTADISTL